jgi:hypothetical protein
MAGGNLARSENGLGGEFATLPQARVELAHHGKCLID